MAITQLYKRYFQKSKVFLYPLLVPDKTHFHRLDTHIALEGMFNIHDYRLLVSRNWHGGKEFWEFERQRFITHPFYEKHFALDTKRVVYVFNLTSHVDDWEYFLEGRYSKLSLTLKRNIRQLYGAGSAEWKYLETFLFPEKYFSLYAAMMYTEEEREEGLVQLRAGGELCDKFNLEKETLCPPNQ